MNPLISVLIVTYNYGCFIAECLGSVFAQTYRNYEVIVIDDGSTDNTEAIMSGYQSIRYIKQEHQGVSAARNAAIKLAKGDYIAFIDADDIWPSSRLENMVNELQVNSECMVVRGKIANFFHDAMAAGSKRAREVAGVDDEKCFIIPALIRKDVFEKWGLFDTGMPFGEDTDLIYRLKINNAVFADIDEVVLHRRIHCNNISVLIKKDSWPKSAAGIIARNLRRRIEWKD